MKNICLVLLFLFLVIVAFGQQSTIDSLKKILNLPKKDTNHVKALVGLADMYSVPNLDSGLYFAQQALLLAKRLNDEKGEAASYIALARGKFHRGNYSETMQFLFKAMGVYERLQNTDGIIAAHMLVHGTYREATDYNKALEHGFAAQKLIEAGDRKGTILFSGRRLMPLILAEIGYTYEEMNQLDSALSYTERAIHQNLDINGAKWNFPIYLLGMIQMKQGKYVPALATYRSAISLANKNGYWKDTLDIYNSIAILFKSSGSLDSAIYFAKAIIDKRNIISHVKILLQATTTLAGVYKLKGDKDNTLKYIELSNVLRDSVYSREKQREFQSVIFNEEIRQQEIQQQQLQNRNKIRSYFLIFGLLFLAVVTFILYRSNIHRRKANIILQNQKEEIVQQRTKAEIALDELKSAQAQLIQREKMASLGELTAGIAHEIQNPLNFINNFSGVNLELFGEFRDVKNKSNNGQTGEDILNDIEQNLEKIIHHGKRADGIVKGMLQHSQTGNQQKEPTDINSLADEYLRLSYHGMRAKDKSFNAILQTDFDDSIGKINIVPQDISRVLLNLYNNAFHAIIEKKKQTHNGYQPTVSVTTKRLGGKIEVRVKDNGNGIETKVMDKIFQPFFTTRPPGQGTGLGLSLSYDIITKGHAGLLKVETKEGEFAEFVIHLPDQ